MSPDDLDLTPASPAGSPSSLLQTTSHRASPLQQHSVTVAQLEKSLRQEVASRAAMADKQEVMQRELDAARAECMELEISMRKARDEAVAQVSEVSKLTARISEILPSMSRMK